MYVYKTFSGIFIVLCFIFGELNILVGVNSKCDFLSLFSFIGDIDLCHLLRPE